MWRGLTAIIVVQLNDVSSIMEARMVELITLITVNDNLPSVSDSEA